MSCTCKHGAPALPLQANVMPHTHLPWHDEPQLHSTKATAAHDHFQQHFTTFTSMVAAGHGAEYPSGATGWRVEEADIVYVNLQGSSQSFCWLFPRMSASRTRVPNPVGSAQPATSVAGPSFAGRSGHDGGTFAATPRRTAALRPPEPPTKPPPTELPPTARLATEPRPPSPRPPPLPPPPSPSSPPRSWSQVSQ